MERVVLNAVLNAPPGDVADVLRRCRVAAADKYIPGPVWAYLARAKRGRERGVPAARVVGGGSPPQQVCRGAMLRALGWFAVAWMGYGLSMLLPLRPVARAATHEWLLPVALRGFAVVWVVHALSDGAWALVGIGLRAPQRPTADGPQPVPR